MSSKENSLSFTRLIFPFFQADSLLDLLGSSDNTSITPAISAPHTTPAPASLGGGVMDLLGDLDMGAPPLNVNSTPGEYFSVGGFIIAMCQAINA